MSQTRRKSRSPLGLLARFWRWIRHSKRGLFHVLLLALLLLLVSGYIRGHGADDWVGETLTWLEDAVRGQLTAVIAKPWAVAAVLASLNYAAFFALMILLTRSICRVPCYLGFIVLSEFHHRQGDNLGKGKVLLGISMPVALVFCLTCHGALSLYAWFHFVVGYTFIRCTNEPGNMNHTLNFYARARTALETPLHAADDDAQAADQDAIS
jgi:hypothetical protein